MSGWRRKKTKEELESKCFQAIMRDMDQELLELQTRVEVLKGKLRGKKE